MGVWVGAEAEAEAEGETLGRYMTAFSVRRVLLTSLPNYFDRLIQASLPLFPFPPFPQLFLSRLIPVSH